MSKGTPLHCFRIDDSLWQPAKAKAETEGVNLSDVIRDALRTFITAPPPPTPQPQPAEPATARPTGSAIPRL